MLYQINLLGSLQTSYNKRWKYLLFLLCWIWIAITLTSYFIYYQKINKNKILLRDLKNQFLFLQKDIQKLQLVQQQYQKLVLIHSAVAPIIARFYQSYAVIEGLKQIPNGIVLSEMNLTKNFVDLQGTVYELILFEKWSNQFNIQKIHIERKAKETEGYSFKLRYNHAKKSV